MIPASIFSSAIKCILLCHHTATLLNTYATYSESYMEDVLLDVPGNVLRHSYSTCLLTNEDRTHQQGDLFLK